MFQQRRNKTNKQKTERWPCKKQDQLYRRLSSNDLAGKLLQIQTLTDYIDVYNNYSNRVEIASQNLVWTAR